MGEAFSFGEAQDHVGQLMLETGSHFYAEMAGYDVAMSQGDLAAVLLMNLKLNQGRKASEKPHRVLFPFSDKPKTADVTPERRAELEAQLARRSAIPD